MLRHLRHKLLLLPAYVQRDVLEEILQCRDEIAHRVHFADLVSYPLRELAPHVYARVPRVQEDHCTVVPLVPDDAPDRLVHRAVPVRQVPPDARALAGVLLILLLQ